MHRCTIGVPSMGYIWPLDEYMSVSCLPPASFVCIRLCGNSDLEKAVLLANVLYIDLY